jgi:hypothetical protein
VSKQSIEPTDAEARNVCGLADHILETVDTFARERMNSDHPLDTGEVLSALVTLLFRITAQQGGDIEQFIETLAANVKHPKTYPRVHDA